MSRALRVAPLAAVVAAAAIVVGMQPVTSPWWFHADADATYSASALEIVSGGHSRYFDHPGLPEQELLALTFGAVSLPAGGPTRQWATGEMTHLDRARPVFRGWAILFFVGGAALAYVLLSRLFGHWSWGAAGGLLWLAQPDLTDAIQIRPDTVLSALLLLVGFLLVRGWERRSPAAYAIAAAVAGFALMTKLSAVAILPALVLATALRPPGPGWGPQLAADAHRFAARHRVGLTTAGALWLAAFLLLNWNRFAIRAHGAHLDLVAALAVAVLAYVLATLGVRALDAGPVLRRVFDPVFILLAAAFVVGLVVPLSLVLSDSLHVLAGTLDSLRGKNINAGVSPFKVSSSVYSSFPLLEAVIFLGLAAVAAIVGAARRNAWPVLWFVAAGVTAFLATLRFGQPRYYAPAYVLAVPAALWLFRRRSSVATPILVWVLVAGIVTPTLLHLRDSAHLASFSEAQARAETRLADRLLKPNEVALLSDYYAPSADVRWWSLVDLYVDDPPPYPYRFVPDIPGAIQTARGEGKHVAYYMGSLALRVKRRERITLGSGTYVALPLPGVPSYPNAAIGAVRLVSGPGT